ncbi:RAD52 motif-containing protein 1-like isoform X1 [Ptychodera flava]|uniref:RAD52 motif-containing protein 1-like isoform X1 n=1 Tax=Ptychodera flava TaxID=63121 RepID=UPI00396A889C
MASAIEIIEFKRPDNRDNNLYLTGIFGNFDEGELVSKLTEIFSQYGLLYEVQTMLGKFTMPACQTEDQPETSSKSYYAFIKYYSTKAAELARTEMNGQPLFTKGHAISIRVANPRKSFDMSQHSLPLWKCRELADYYLGFNSWSNTITSIVEDDDFQEEGSDNTASTIRYMCITKLELPRHDVQTEGLGIGEADYNPKDVSTKGSAIAQAKKIAYRRASENAFSKLVLVVFGDGRVMVEVNNTQPDLLEYINDDLDEELIKVNQLEAVETEDSADQTDEGAVDTSELDQINAQMLLDLEQDV